MDKKINQQGFAYWIPATLAESGDHLKALLYGLIYSLTDENNNCWAGNEYLAKKLGRKDKSIISVKIKELEKDSWVSVDNALGKNRMLHLTIGKNQRLPLEKTNGQPLEISNESNNTVSNINKYNIAFEKFWELYPKKVEKKKSEDKWNKLKKETQELILLDLPKRVKCDSWQKGYILNPMTYLNGERWNDQIIESQTVNKITNAIIIR